jgi:hypothetical protein
MTRLDTVIATNLTGTTILQACHIIGINSALFTVQGENCTITLEIYNNSSVIIPVNFTLIGSSFIGIAYPNVNLAIGLNLLEFNITAKEFSPLGLQSITFNTSRWGTLIAINITTTTILGAYSVIQFSASPYTVQGENCTVTIELNNQRSIPIPMNFTLVLSGASTSNYINYYLNVGFNVLKLDFSFDEFAALGQQLITVNTSRMDHLVATNTTCTTILPAYRVETIFATPYTVQGERCTVIIEIYNNRSSPIPLNFTLWSLDAPLTRYLNSNLNLGMNILELNLTFGEFAQLTPHLITMNASRLNHSIAVNATSTTILPAYRVETIFATPYTVQGERCTVIDRKSVV